MLLQGYAPSDLVILVTYAGQLHHVKRCLEAAQLRLLISERDREQMEMARLEAEGDGEEEGEKDDKAGPSGGATTTAVLSSVASRKGPGAPSWGPPPNEDMHVPPGSRVVTMKEGVRVATVDNFQGEEATLVLLSTVRNNKEGHVGFINMTNRVNVMLSRARHGMVVLGNAATLRAAQQRGAGMWGQVLDILDKDGCVDSCLKIQCVNHGTVTEIREVADFQRLAGDGGCQLPCGAALPCGHTCPRRCHADDLQHVSVVCTKPCQRLHTECGHPCDRTCGEPCGRCERTITEPFRLDCGHTAMDVPCWKRDESGAIQCREPVEVDLAGCGHTLTVPCCEAEGVRAGAVPCRAPVTVQLPVCGHSVTVACGARQAALRDPTACTHKCGQLLGCEHTCGAECGKCVRAVLVENAEELMEAWLQQQPVELRDAWTRHTGGAAAARLDLLLRFLAPGSPADGHRDAYYTWLKSRLTDAGHARRYAGSHRRCTRRCGRVLVCGHECGEACHAGRPCGGCRQPCWIGCAHHRCRRQCGEPCVPCAEPCVWRCEHRGACGAPCGAPCDRLPCDARCSRKLACGHRCPGLCGEECPPARFCVAPRCMGKAKEEVKSQVVDQVLLRTFGELSPEDVDEDPVLVLPCGHAFLTSTLDGHMELDRCYARDPAVGAGDGSGGGGGCGAWLCPLPLGDDSGSKQPVKGCPNCRQPIHGVRRYGRPAAKAALDLIQRKHMHGCAQRLQAAEQRLGELMQQVLPPPQQQVSPGTEAAGGAGAAVGGGGAGAAAGAAAQAGAAVAAAAPAGASSRLDARLSEVAEERGVHPDRMLKPMHALHDHVLKVRSALDKICDEYTNPPKRRVYEAAVVTLQRAQRDEEEQQAQLRSRKEAADGLLERPAVGGCSGGGDSRRTPKSGRGQPGPGGNNACGGGGGTAGSISPAGGGGRGRDVPEAASAADTATDAHNGSGSGGSTGGGGSGGTGRNIGGNGSGSSVHGGCDGGSGGSGGGIGDGASGSGGGNGRSGGGRGGVSTLPSRLAVARADLLLLRPDTTQLCRAWAGQLRAARVYVLATAAGVRQAGRLLRRAGLGAGVLNAARESEQQRHWRRAVITYLRGQALHLVTESFGICSSFLSRNLPQWRSAAVSSSNFCSALRLSACGLQLGVAQLGLVRAAEGLPRGALLPELGGSRELAELRKGVLEKLRAEGGLALELYDGASGFGASGQANEHVDDIRATLQQLDRMEQQVDIQEVWEALSAVAGREYGGAADAIAWLQQHLYTCPNGHLYTIGECGGAMQRSRCPECGATIGGGSHTLQQGNRRADEALEALRQMGGNRRAG